MFRASTVPFIRSYQLYTCQLVCFMHVTRPLPRTARLEFQPDCPRQRPHNLHETYQLPRVQLITPDEWHSRCPKHVEFRDKITFWIRDESCWLFIRRKWVHSFHTIPICTNEFNPLTTSLPLVLSTKIINNNHCYNDFHFPFNSGSKTC